MLNDLINSINDSITNNLGFSTEQVYGITELHSYENKTHPAVYDNGQWNQISLDDANELMIYHRVSEISTEENQDFSFGSFSNDNQENIGMIMTVVMKRPNTYQEALNVKSYIPKQINNADYAFVTITGGSINTNQDAIIESEWGSQDYRRHKTDFSIFQISYNIETIVCTH